MAFLYATRIIKVTDRMRRIVIGATLALAAFYLISFLVSLIGLSVPLIWDAGPFGILFSVAVCGLAAVQPRARLRPRRAGRTGGPAEGVRVVLRVRV